MGTKKAASQTSGNAANLIEADSLTSLRWHDPDQVQRVVPFQDSQFKNTPSGRDWSRLFHISHKSRIIDVIIKKSNMHFMFSSLLLHVLLVVFMLGMGGCVTRPVPVTPYFEIPPEYLSKADIDLYSRALEQLKNNQLDNSIDLWKRFLERSPKSFRGYNNLGMALYSNDKLRLSIEAFETALSLEPFDHTIKDNLKRALRFQVTILRENKDYATAIEHLERVKKLSDLKKKEKVALKIEILQDLIYQQVKLANTLEGYEAFVAKYPDNPKNADEARRLILKMKPQNNSSGEFPNMLGERLPDPLQNTSSSELGVTAPEPMQSVPALPPLRSETIDIIEETKQSKEVEEFSEDTQKPMVQVAKPGSIEQPPVEAIAVSPDMEMKREKPEPSAHAALPQRRAQIITKGASLRVRAKPDAQSNVLAQIPKDTIVLVFQEAKDWFQVEYQKGKKGWISKKFSQLVN
jgi:tetratricopeptide (TPR) repeat protein